MSTVRMTLQSAHSFLWKASPALFLFYIFQKIEDRSDQMKRPIKAQDFLVCPFFLKICLNCGILRHDFQCVSKLHDKELSSDFFCDNKVKFTQGSEIMAKNSSSCKWWNKIWFSETKISAGDIRLFNLGVQTKTSKINVWAFSTALMKECKPKG